MPIIDSLKKMGVDTDDAVAVAKAIGSMSMTNAEKKAALEMYFMESGKTLTADIIAVAPYMR